MRMIAAAPIVLEATAEVSDDAGGLADGDTDAKHGGSAMWTPTTRQQRF
jgi:hypothetical protein